MKLDTTSTRNQGVIMEYLWGRRSYKETQEILKEFGDYIEEEEGTNDNP